MKYTNIIAILLIAFLLTACFQKPSDDIDNSQTGTVVEEDTTQNDDEDASDDIDTDEDSEENSDEEENNEDEENSDTSTEVEASGSVTTDSEEEVVIEEIEAELEELFSDLLGDDEEK